MATILDRGYVGHSEWTLERLSAVEEGQCQRCGWPCYSGEEAYLTDEGDLYCSGRCMSEEYAEGGAQ